MAKSKTNYVLTGKGSITFRRKEGDAPTTYEKGDRIEKKTYDNLPKGSKKKGDKDLWTKEKDLTDEQKEQLGEG